MREITQEINHYARNQHFDHAPPRLQGLGKALQGRTVDQSDRHSPMQSFGTHEQMFRHKHVERYLNHKRQEVEQGGFYVFKDHKVEHVVIGKDDHTIEDVEGGVALHDFIKQEGGEAGQACARPDTAQHEYDPSLVADDVCFDWVDDGHIPERKPKRLKFHMFNV